MFYSLHIKNNSKTNTVWLRFFDKNSRAQRRKSSSLKRLIIVETAIHRVFYLTEQY